MSNRWQDEVSEDQWNEWMKLARKLSSARGRKISTGYSEYSSAAIEKLLQQEKRPANIEAWLALTIKNLYIDRFRRMNAYGGIHKADLDDEQWEYEMVRFAIRSPSQLIGQRDQIERIMNLLSEREREILIMAAAGYDNHAIASHLGYATNKVVATRIRQISEKVIKLIEAESQAFYEAQRNNTTD